VVPVLATRVIYDLVARDYASREFARAGNSASGLDRTISKLGHTVALAGAAMAAGAVAIGVESVKAATNFQSAMTKIQTQAGGSARDVKLLSAEVLKLGTYAQQSPQQLADSLFHLKSVGLDNVKAMKALKTASDLAAVGGANLEDTTNALAGAWRSGIKGAGNFSHAAATLNAIVGAGNMKMQDLVGAMGTGFLSSARTFGVSLKSVGSALALMTDEGTPADAAATRLRMSISLLGAPSAAAAKQLASIGIGSVALGNAMRGPQGIIGAISLLKSHLDASGLSATRQAQLLSHAFGGGRSSSAILLMVNQLDVLRKKQDQINSSMGRFGPAVEAQRRTAQAQFALLKSTLDVIEVKLGTTLLPMVTRFATFLNLRVIPDLVKFAQWISSPNVRPWAEFAGKLAAAALAAELIRQALAKAAAITGLSRLKAVATATPAAAAANMSGAAKVMFDASLNMLKAAGIEADAAGAGIAGAGSRGAGAAAGAAEGAAAAGATVGRSLIARIGSFAAAGLVKIGWAALITDLVVRPLLNKIKISMPSGKEGLWAATGPQPGGKGESPGDSWSALLKFMTKPGSFGAQIAGLFRTPSPAPHTAPVPSHFAPGPGITVGTPKVASHFAPAPGSGAVVLSAADKHNLLWLEQVYGVGLPKAYGLASAAGDSLATRWGAQNAVAQNARTRMAGLTAALTMMHGGQKQATADATSYTTALRLNGVASTLTIGARRKYIADLVAAHVPEATAVRLANQLATGINTLGNRLGVTHPSMRTLVGDLTASGVHANTARSLVSKYTNAVQNNGANSDQARGARQKLIRDLENAGLSADQARKLVRNYTGQLDKIPANKRTTITLVGAGGGKVTVSSSVKNAAGFLEFHARGYRVPGYGGGDTYGPIMVERGETIVPKYLTPAVAPLMKAHKVPGFATGGLVGMANQITSAGVPFAQNKEAIFGSAMEAALVQPLLAALKAHVAAAARAAAAATFGAGPGGGAPSANAALARRLFPAWGSGANWSAWNYVAMRESGWSQFARNPSSGAYGIPQALPPSKMGAAANPPRSNPAAQIRWMASYMSGRYGGPIGAAAHERSFSWYGRGGGFRANQLIGVGDRGRELISFSQPGQVHSPEASAAMLGGGDLLGALLTETRAMHTDMKRMHSDLVTAAPEKTGRAVVSALSGGASRGRQAAYYGKR
jgi:TP901 family phage tail tape measure protein